MRTLLFAAGSVAAAALSVLGSMGHVLAWTSPGTALAINPRSMRALEARATLEQARGPHADRAMIAASAERALRSRVLAPGSLRLLANNATASGQRSRALELATMSRAISRRDLGTHLWFLRDAVERRQPTLAMRRLDFALRSHDGAPQQVFPTLVNLLRYPKARVEIVRLTRDNPPWLAAFYSYAIANAQNLPELAEIASESGRMPSDPRYPGLGRALLQGLIDADAVGSAAILAHRTNNRSEIAALERVSFASDGREPPFGWRYTSEADYGAGPDGQGGMAVFAQAGQRGTVAQKLLILSSGAHQLSVRYGAVALDPTAQVLWRLTCPRPNATSVAWESAPLAPAPNAVGTATFTVPASCQIQRLELSIVTGTRGEQSDFTVRSVAISG